MTVPTVSMLRPWATFKVMMDPYGFYARCREQHGDTFEIRAINGDVVCSCDPAFVKDLLKLDSTRTRPFAVAAAAPLLGRHGLLMIEGDAHRQERRLLTPPFHGRRMRAYGDTIQSCARDVLAARWTDGAEVSARDDMLDISFRVIVRAVFGVVDDASVEGWVAAVRGLVDGFSPAMLFAPMLQRLPVGPWRRFERARDTLDRLLYAEIGARRGGEGGDDILSMMLDATYEDGSSMSDVQVRDELVTLLFAGHETTQITMAWALYRLARHPEVMARLQAELDATDGSPEALATAEYLAAVVQETLRLQPIVPDVIRTLVGPETLGGVSYEAGTHVAFIPALVHQREDLYPEPEAFRPERFLERKFGPHEFLAFGGGVRRCIGAALATYEMKVVLGTLLREVDVVSLSEETPVRRSVTMATSGPVRLRVRRRSDAVSATAA